MFNVSSKTHLCQLGWCDNSIARSGYVCRLSRPRVSSALRFPALASAAWWAAALLSGKAYICRIVALEWIITVSRILHFTEYKHREDGHHTLRDI